MVYLVLVTAYLYLEIFYLYPQGTSCPALVTDDHGLVIGIALLTENEQLE